MPALTSYGSQQALKSLFGGGNVTPGTLYFGLSSTTVNIDGSGITEPTAQVQLNAALSTGAAITSLTVTALSAPIASGANIKVSSGANNQTFTASATASAGATTISVTSQTPNFAYPVGSLIQDTTDGYARIAVTNNTSNFGVTQIPVGSGGGAQAQNAVTVGYPTSTAAFPNPITYWFVSDAPGGGNIIASGSVSSQTVGVNNTLSFATNQLTVQNV